MSRTPDCLELGSLLPEVFMKKKFRTAATVFTDRLIMARVLASNDRTNYRRIGAHWILSLAIALGALASFAHAQAQSTPFVTGFPIHDASGKEVNPYTAPIVSVVDHYANGFGLKDKRVLTVEAYTGEEGSGPCGPSGEPCGRYNRNFLPPLNGQSILHFYVNGSYVGTTTDGTSREEVLNYRGHSGYDYGYPRGTAVYAAHDGDVFMPASDPILGSPLTYNTFYMMDASGWSTWYLHTEVNSITVRTPICTIVGLAKGEKLPDGDTCVGHVQRDDPVAVVWDTGVPSPHLHFEVRAACDFGASTLTGCKVVDPYGWEWVGNDPLGVNNPTQGMSGPAPLWDLARWNLTQPQVTGAVVAVAGNTWTITINGSNFDTTNPVVTLWHVQNFYCFVCGDPQSPANVSVQPGTATQFTAQVQIIDTTLNLTPDLTVVKVSNGSNGPGPRSPGTTLSVPTSAPPPTSYSLLLYKTPAPGGGVFLGFGGFHSATDDGQVVFNSGVDLNGDDIPDVYSDFIYSSSGLSQVAFSGFTQIFNTVMNSRGDKAFSGTNQAAGRTSAGIYLLQAGATTAIKVAQPGDTCPSPCPGLASFLNVAGPFAIGEAGEVVFSAQLMGKTTAYTWVLYLYSPSDGSYTKVAADGSGGDATPVGGYFTSQNFFGSAGIVPSTGDVIFSDLVTAGASAGGIFRFSRATGALSKLVVQGDPASSGVTGTLGIPLGSIGGQSLVFYASVNGGNTNQVIGLIPDITVASLRTTLVASEGESTGTVAGGKFATAPGNAPLPFAFYGENLGAPEVRKDGSVVFSSVLVGASSWNGSPTDEGLFLWNGRTFSKIVVDGDQLSNGRSVEGVVQFILNDVGNVYYFATTEN